jgi:hypothetical protein
VYASALVLPPIFKLIQSTDRSIMSTIQSHFVAFRSGDKGWYKDGKRHRDGDSPAYVTRNGDKYWYKDGKLHRDGDSPAVVNSNGDKYWYKDGKLHRDGDSPAIVYSNGDKSWFKDGIQNTLAIYMRS